MTSPASWIVDHWTQILAWSGAVVFFQRVYVAVSKVMGARSDLITLKLDLKLLKENHLPHIQQELEDINSNISGLRQTSKEGFEGVREGLAGLRDDIRAVLVMGRHNA